ncbi:MAG: DEAD/DEAH box helicase, partial [Verrucomicrobia bacterium]|nr:DEAD/DEAH box helicase [Verrucomicrobiota bacterium]
YAFVLTGTPLESRLDELYSLVSFLDPSIFGPLFRFNREFLDFDSRGRPRGYKNLDRLRERLRPILLRRRKSDVSTQLPGRTDRTFLVPLGDAQRAAYRAHEGEAARLCALARKRPLAPAQRERLLRALAQARMLCDTPYILEHNRAAAWRDAPPATTAEAEKLCPKLGELARLLRECAANPQVKVLVFSEWERMLELVRGVCQRLRIAHAFHAGSVPAGQRRAEVQRFKTDPACRVFLSTDTAGGASLNLPQASVVIHCDQPWNPARLETRVARAWQPEQTRAVTVLHLVSEGTIEQRLMLARAGQQALSARVLDDPRAGKMETKLVASAAPSEDDLLDRLQALLASTEAAEKPAAKLPARSVQAEEEIPPAERARIFGERAAALLKGGLLSIDERATNDASDAASSAVRKLLLVVVENGEAERSRALLEPLRARCFPPQPGGIFTETAVGLEVIDRATADLLHRLRAAGLVGEAAGTVRRIYPPEGKSAEANGDRAARQFFTGIRAQLERIGAS